MLEDAEAQLLIADESLLPLVPDYRGYVLLTKDIQDLPQVSQLLIDHRPVLRCPLYLLPEQIDHCLRLVIPKLLPMKTLEQAQVRL